MSSIAALTEFKSPSHNKAWIQIFQNLSLVHYFLEFEHPEVIGYRILAFKDLLINKTRRYVKNGPWKNP